VTQKRTEEEDERRQQGEKGLEVADGESLKPRWWKYLRKGRLPGGLSDGGFR